MIFLSAGHHAKDPGAVSGKYIERDLAIELRNLTEAYLKTLKADYILDKDPETLSQYLSRIKPGSASVVVEIHWNSSASSSSTGTEVFVSNNANKISKDLASDIVIGLSSLMDIRNRGVKTERESARGSLAFLKKPGANCLIEICFINNSSDMKKYESAKCKIAEFLANTLVKYDAKI